MNILKTGVLATALSMPLIGAGCNQATNKEQEEIVAAKHEGLAETPLPLKELRNVSDGILHLFDTNKNEILDPEEIDLFIKVVINKGTGKYTEEGQKKLWDVRFQIYKQGRGYGNGGPYQPNNIKTSIDNLWDKAEEYNTKRREQINEEVKQGIEKELKNTKTK